MSLSRVTQKDIALRAGVSVATVSFALKGHPGIPAKTRERILKIATELGYTPDPMLSALAAYRSKHRAQSYRGTLAWLVNHGTLKEYDWYNIRMFREYFLGAKQEAASYGYNLDVFDLNFKGIGTKRMATILDSQNVKGILLCPQPAANMEIDFPWQRFSAITFGYTLAKPKLHLVTSAHYRCVTETIQHLHSAGYHRIGYVNWTGIDKRDENNSLAAYLIEQHNANLPEPIPILTHNYHKADVFLPWLKRYQVDSIITPNAGILDTLKKFNLSIPRDLGVACFALSEDDGQGLAGIRQNPQHCGRTAVSFLISMMQRGERGIPELQKHLLVEGIWVSENSLRQGGISQV